jgi:N-acetylglutamate synthase-like GNAT family acetyltransferase
MELANLAPSATAVRLATKADAPTILRLLQGHGYKHIHVDWFLPGDWLGREGFVVWERPRGIHACLAVAAAPPPAAWVRLAAVEWEVRHTSLTLLGEMLAAVRPHLQAQGITQIGWMSSQHWADRWLPDLGFETVAWLESYMKEDVDIPPHHALAGVVIRPLAKRDLPLLAELETAAFAPLWRQDARSLELGWGQALSFDVAEVEGQIVGFQHSVPTQEQCAHLARMTIHPEWQGRGVGSALMAYALRGYEALGFGRASLNAQMASDAAHALYTKFGFMPMGYQVPVWVAPLG